MTFRRALPPALAGAAASAALLTIYARIEAPSHWLGPVALAPWLIGLDRARSLPAALAAAAALALGWAALALAWFPPAVAAFTGMNAPAAWALTLGAAPLVVSPQLLVTAAARCLTARRGSVAAALATAFVYTGSEWLLPKLFGDTLGYGLYPAAGLRQAADLAGVRGLTFLVVLASAGVAALAARRWAPLALAAAAWVAAWGYGARRLEEVRAETAAAPRLRAGVVQANVTRVDKMAATAGAFDAFKTILDAHFALSERLLGEGPLDVVVWPETAYPTTWGAPGSPDAAAFDRAIAGFAGTHQVGLVFGAFERDGDGAYNSAFFLTPSGDRGLEFDSYKKTLLFPLTERRFRAGPGPRALPLARGVSAGPLICYEALHPGHAAKAVRAGADVLVTLSNDAWFPSAEAPRLHLLMAAMRSVETRRSQIRATNSGLSALILPDGELVGTTGFDTPAAFRAEVPLLRGRPTRLVAWGDWMGPASLLLGALAVLFCQRRERSVRS